METMGVMVLVIAEVTIRLGIDPQEISRIFPFGLMSGMILAEARASRVLCVTLLTA